MQKQSLKRLLISTLITYLLVFLVGELLFNDTMRGNSFLIEKRDYYFTMSIPLVVITAYTVLGTVLHFFDIKER